jgi:glycosyltransferase involved in cell wall biosynthesis
MTNNGVNGLQPQLSLVIPLLNEYESLPLLHEKTTRVVERLNLPYEIIYVDDGSTDGSTEWLVDLQQRDAHVVLAVQRRNFGKSLALGAGFRLARGTTIITMDADLQDEPEEIPTLLAKLDEGYDVVSGWKKNRQDPLSKRIPSRIANRTTAIMTGVQLNDMNSGFKAYNATCVRRLHLYGDLHRYVPVLAHFAGFRVTEVPVTHHKRQFGQSKYGPGRLLRGGLDLMTVLFLNQYGRRPLHLFGGAGGVMLLLGLFINGLLAIDWFRGVRPIGDRPALILGVLLMLMGVQLLTMGLIAELLVHFIQRNENPLSTLEAIYKHDASKVQDEITDVAVFHT